jgi:hypothetical protein
LTEIDRQQEVREEEPLLPRLPLTAAETQLAGRDRGEGWVVGRVAQRCIRGERECKFTSPLSSDAKCLLCIHALLDNILVMHSVLEDA